MRTGILLAIMFSSTAMAAPPAQESVTVTLGAKRYRDGDVIEIRDVRSTSHRLEQGDSVTVSGRVRLESHQAANVCLLVTQTEGDGKEETDPGQTVRVSTGLQDFTLTTVVKHRGVLHVTLYDTSGRPIGGTYFGTPDQIKKVSRLDLGYYVRD